MPPRWHSSSRGSWVWGEAATIRLNGSWVAKRQQKLNENIEATHKEEKPLTVQVQAIGSTQSLVFNSGVPANNIFRCNSSKDTIWISPVISPISWNVSGKYFPCFKTPSKTKILGASYPSEGPLEAWKKKTARNSLHRHLLFRCRCLSNQS